MKPVPHIPVTDAQRQRQIDANPHLLVATSSYLANATHAGRNIRRVLNAAYPEVRFSVRQHKPPMASHPSLIVEWFKWDDAPTAETIAALVKPFEHPNVHSLSPPNNHDAAHAAFRAAFGGAGFVSVKAVQPTLEDRIQHEREILGRAIANPKATPAAPDVQPSGNPHRSRRRL